MKKLVKITLLCIMGIYLMFGFAAIVNASFSYTQNQTVSISATAPDESESTTADLGYIVKTVRGRVAVEDVDTGKIIKITDTRTAILPEKDRNALEKGITVSDKSELRSVLEDLCS